jgi:hypothetical protein
MNAVDFISTGLPGLDKVVDGLRMGDNVVWQVDSIDDYRHFAEPFAASALADNRRVVYMRFGRHPAVVETRPGIKVYILDPNTGFEAFSCAVHTIAAKEGEGVFYIFDSLSELLSAWATDLMIGNFFKVTCPYLFELNTIAYFAVLRNTSSYHTMASIRETTQLLLDVYNHEKHFYIHPIKAWKRYSPTMFLPHVSSGEEFVPVSSSFDIAKLFSKLKLFKLGDASRRLDYWDRILIKAQELMDRLDQGDPAAVLGEREMVKQLCRMMIGRDERILLLAQTYFSLKDLLEIKNRLIGSGFIGGKTVGMLLARSILKEDREVNWEQNIEQHDSFYVGSDVYYTYLVENGCWKTRVEQKKKENYYTLARELQQRILDGAFPAAIRDQFDQILEYFGQSPIIVRSSSLLEDAFGNSFAGKYRSVFCVNQGTPQERYHAFEKAVKQVFASTMGEDALAYRLQRGLDQSDEQMALLVQRVSGSSRSGYFFPDLAGVAMSHNAYVWSDDMDPDAGMLRLVFGLGTRAVDRVEDDYPRLVALDKPLLRPDSRFEDIRKFSQHKVDVLDITLNDNDTVLLNDIYNPDAKFPVWDLLAVRDHETDRKIKELGYRAPASWVLTFEKLMSKTDFPRIVQQMLKKLEAAYKYPVDIEFTANFSNGGGFEINLLQCRPLQIFGKGIKHAAAKGITPDNTLFANKGSFMGSDILQAIKTVVYIKAEEYSKLSVTDKYEVARLVGKINRLFHDREKEPMMFIGPGRWGTSTPSLGVPVSFAEISNAAVLAEVASPKEGYVPEVSYGTHFFQDLVESKIFYIALFPGRDDTVFNPTLLDQFSNLLFSIFPEYSRLQHAVKIFRPAELRKKLWLQARLQPRSSTSFFTGH